MQYTTLQLLLRRWYSGVEISEAEAASELDRRGFIKPLRILFLLVIIPFIFPERLLVSFDQGDEWESADLRAVIFSVVFSVWLLSSLAALPFLVMGVAMFFGGYSGSYLLVLSPLIAFAVSSAALWVIRYKGA